MIFQTLPISWDQYLTIVKGVIVFNVIMFFVVLYFTWWRRRNRIKVRVKTPLEEWSMWVKPEDDGKTLILEKERGKTPEWKATFTAKSVVPFRRWFGRIGRAVDIFYHAEKCIDWDHELDELDQPKYDKKTSKRYIEAKVLKEMGEGIERKTPLIFWVIVVVALINVGITFLIAQGLGII